MGGSSSKASSTLTPTDKIKRKEVLIKEKPRFFMHLDADRDGKVDDNFQDLDKWVWGKAGRGAAILVNNNAKTHSIPLDHDDATINGADDVKDIAPLDIRRIGPTPPSGWSLKLSIPKALQAYVRVFDSRVDAGKEILGPGKGITHTFPTLAFDKKELGIEAVKYAGKGFDGLIKLTLQIWDGTDLVHEQHAKVRVAPWMMFNHLNAPEKLFVVATSDNGTFVSALKGAATKAGLPVQSASGVDRWMQDIMEFGFSELPGSAPLRNVMETPRGRELAGVPKFLVKNDLGYLMPAPVPLDAGGLENSSSLNSGGNLECTPPYTAPNGKVFPFGRIYCCAERAHDPSDALAPGYKEFLEAQLVQTPISIDAGWLSVGHVDEMISFIPAKSKLGFKLLLASPDLGMKILTDSASSGAKMLIGRDYVSGVSAEISVSDFLAHGIDWKDARSSGSFLMNAREIKAYNSNCQQKIAKAERKFRSAMGLTDDDIAYVPSIYVHPVGAPGAVALADALTAGMVNMLVLESECISPKPFGPVAAGKDLFEEHFRDTLAKEALNVTFIDDWATYHLLKGEVHCGTNTLRKADSKTKWWEFEP
jgi:hypothetical protein